MGILSPGFLPFPGKVLIHKAHLQDRLNVIKSIQRQHSLPYTVLTAPAVRMPKILPQLVRPASILHPSVYRRPLD